MGLTAWQVVLMRLPGSREPQELAATSRCGLISATCSVILPTVVRSLPLVKTPLAAAQVG